MSLDKIGNHLILGCSSLAAIHVGLTGFAFSITYANAAQARAATATTFRTKCAICHEPEGAGNEVGKRMDAPDLHLQTGQQLTSVELTEIISDGKAGMSSFKSSFSANQIQALVNHVRTRTRRK